MIVRGARAGRVTPSGHLLFARGHAIFAAPFDLRSVGDARPTRSRCWTALRPVSSGVPLLDVSDRGDLGLLSGQGPGEPTGMGERANWRTLRRRGYRRRTYVPDPRLLARRTTGRRVTAGTADHFLWLWALDTGTLTPFVTGYDTHGRQPGVRTAGWWHSRCGRASPSRTLKQPESAEVVLEGKRLERRRRGRPTARQSSAIVHPGPAAS